MGKQVSLYEQLLYNKADNKSFLRYSRRIDEFNWTSNVRETREK